jgi:hypothetical protein
LASVFGQFICTTRRRGRGGQWIQGGITGGYHSRGNETCGTGVGRRRGESTGWFRLLAPFSFIKYLGRIYILDDQGHFDRDQPAFPLEFVDAEFSLKPPKLDGWISRRAPLKADRGVVRSINAAEESFTKTQLRIISSISSSLAPPLIDLYARLSLLPDSELLKRPVQAALQQWGRAFHYITKERRKAVIALAKPGSEYLLRDPKTFDSGKEARSFFLRRDIYKPC